MTNSESPPLWLSTPDVFKKMERNVSESEECLLRSIVIPVGTAGQVVDFGKAPAA